MPPSVRPAESQSHHRIRELLRLEKTFEVKSGRNPTPPCPLIGSVRLEKTSTSSPSPYARS